MPVEPCRLNQTHDRMNGHDPYAYLKDVLARLPTQRASEIAELLRQSRVTYIAYRFRLPRWVLRMLRPFIHLYTRIVIRQDVKIIQAHRQGLDNAPDFKPSNVQADAIHVGVEQLLAAVRRGEDLPSVQHRESRIRFEL